MRTVAVERNGEVFRPVSSDEAGQLMSMNIHVHMALGPSGYLEYFAKEIVVQMTNKGAMKWLPLPCSLHHHLLQLHQD